MEEKYKGTLLILKQQRKGFNWLSTNMAHYAGYIMSLVTVGAVKAMAHLYQ